MGDRLIVAARVEEQGAVLRAEVRRHRFELAGASHRGQRFLRTSLERAQDADAMPSARVTFVERQRRREGFLRGRVVALESERLAQ